MKFYHLLFLLILFTGCSAQKNTTALQQLEKIKSFSTSNCPDDGVCNIQIIPNKSIELKKDKFDQLYGETIDSDKILIKYSYKRNVLENTADAHYSETYYINISKDTKELDFNDLELQKVDLVVNRLCYCKGTTGFFKITNGNLKLHIKKNELTLSGVFSHKKLPLIVTKIDEKMNLAQ